MAVTFFHTVKSFTQFLWNWKLQGSQLVDQNTANLRAEICVPCHNNKKSSEAGTGCNTCNKLGNKLINQIRDTIITGNRTPSDANLKSCAICGCDNKISVWIPNEVLVAIEDVNAFPDFCWKKKRVDNQNL